MSLRQGPPLVIAHRGASGLVRFGNTRESFERAIEVGAPMLELDVRRLGDGTIVVHHDADLGHRPLHELDWPVFHGATRLLGYEGLRLADALDLCAGRIRVDVELKEPGYEAEVARIVRDRLGPEQAILKSFWDPIVARLRGLMPGYPLGLLLGSDAPMHRLDRHLPHVFPERRLLRLRPDFVSPGWQWMRMGFLRRMRALGYPVLVWTVNDAAMMRDLLARGAAGIITDRPDLALQILADRDGLRATKERRRPRHGGGGGDD